ncbi:hypothetical protein CTA2_12219, partial [Colletotrichum tanaceti]
CCSDNNLGSYPARTPTRLIDVSLKGWETVRLLKTGSSQQGEATFKDAIRVTQECNAAFLGDARFPNVATSSSKGSQIQLYKSLYTRYSQLQFSNIRNRPIAIARLEQRLVCAFDTEGGYSVFKRYFGRGLLWRRDLDDLQTALERIDFAPTHRQQRQQQQQRLRSFRVPSWSWMAYKGSITFIDLPFDAVLWETDDIKSPWYYPPRNGSGRSWLSASSDSSQSELVGVARDFVELVRDDGRIVYDGGERPRDVALKCVVVRSRKSEVAAKSYVLVIALKSHGEGGAAYERVGVGAIPGSWIVTGQPGLEVRIV